MTKHHLKRNMINKRWLILKKESKYVLKPNAGKHAIKDCLPVGWFLKNKGFVKTAHEAKKLVLMNDVLIDKRKVNDIKCNVGFLDVVSVNDKNYRCVYDNKGKIVFFDIDAKESSLKICKILNKTKLKKGGIQLNLSDGRNIIVDDDKYKCKDSVVVELPSQKIVKHLPFKEGACIFLTDGNHVGSVGNIVKFDSLHVFFNNADNTEESTLKEYAFVIGDKDPEIKLK